MDWLIEYDMFTDCRVPHVHQCLEGKHDLAEYVAANRGRLREQLTESGALLFRGFDVASVKDFERFTDSLGQDRADYVYRSTPRTSIGQRVFTATEYPADQEIPMHNELAYHRTWPTWLAFCCLLPPQTGGATPLADMRQVSSFIGEELLDRFEKNQVRYVRHYHPYVDLSWQNVFQTSDKSEVASFCAEREIGHEWLDEETLRTSETCQGVITHPATGERLLFNQAHLFHASSLGETIASSLIDTFGTDRLPRNAFYGDGSEIPADDLATVRAALARCSRNFPWEKGDVVWIDNLQVSHGRQSFTGPRKVITAMGSA